MPGLARAIAFGFVGFLLGFGSSLLFRVVQVTPQPALPPAQNIVDHIIYGSDLRQLRSIVQDDPSVVNLAQSGMLPILAAISLRPTDVDLIQYLLNVGADPALVAGESVATLHHSALSYSAWCGDYIILSMILNYTKSNVSNAVWQAEAQRAKKLLAIEHPHLIDQLPWP
jgi:hypothetical protein